MFLQIPTISIYEQVYPGNKSKDSLKRGLWKLPYSVIPNIVGQGSNLVIVGHRISFGHVSPPPFFYLNLLEQGDLITVYYKNRRFKYEIKKVFDTEYTNVKIEEVVEGEDKLTLYTCTPILNPSKRLVVKAYLVSIE